MQLFMILLFTFTQASGSLEYSFDESGKIVFMEVVNTKLGYDTLFQNLDNLGFDMDRNDDKGIVVKTFKKAASFMLYNKRISKVPHGRLSYTLLIEVKDNRYRYLITDFVFHEYERNRYGRFEEKRNSEKAIEPLLKNPDKKWENHSQTILEKMESEITKLKEDLETIPVGEKQKKKVEFNDDW